MFYKMKTFTKWTGNKGVGTMKKSFIRALSVICAILLLTATIATWAEAGSLATPTDLAPAETKDITEETGENPPEGTGEESGTAPGNDQPGENPGDLPTGDPAGNTDENPEEQPKEQPEGNPEDQSGDAPEVTPGDKPSEKPDETPKDKPEVTPGNKPQEPAEDNKPEEKPAENPEETVEAEEVLITKALRIGESWSGRVSKKKPAVLKLEVGQAQKVHMLVEGKGVWASVVKADRLNDNPARTQTDPETDRVVISWRADAGAYLINVGPAEYNLMANASVTFMNEAAYEAWQAEQEPEETDPEDNTEEENKPESGNGEEEKEPEENPADPAPETEETGENEETNNVPDESLNNDPDNSGEEPEEEPAAEGGEEPSDDETEGEPEEPLTDPEAEEAEETAEEGEQAEEQGEEQGEEAEEGTSEEETTEEESAEEENTEEETTEEEPEAEEAVDEEQLLSQGYFKVQVVQAEGADVFETTEEGAEPVEHLEMGAELWVKTTEEEAWAVVFSADEEKPAQYIRWDDLVIIRKTENEQEETEEEVLPARYVEICSTLADYDFVSLGTEITMTARLFNFREEDVCTFQWKYFSSAENDFVDIEGANEASYSYHITEENINYYWKLVVTISNEEQPGEEQPNEENTVNEDE